MREGSAFLMEETEPNLSLAALAHSFRLPSSHDAYGDEQCN